ncbi:SiaB family protein kinase [Anaerospora hongkongensis]|uniref:SiaB family protein kinase n=1 Tax=Anaerospora hongkongensis TaxID=244830 RepID=UPI002FD9F47E
MINENLHQLIGELTSYGIIVSFNGSFTQGIIEEIGTAITSYLQAERNTDETESHNVFSVYIEQAQNIKTYFLKKAAAGDKLEISRRAFESIIVIGRLEERFFVCSGNLVQNEDVNSLKERIDYVNSLTKEQLKKLYKETLRRTDSHSDSAGLGIIDMARKAALPLEYMFIARDEQYSFFTLKVSL